MTRLRIADGLSLPLDAVTQAIGIVAKRRVGKSYTARRFAEQLLKAGQQVVIADPKGDWWGIRSAADGKAPGYPVVILGGEHGDLPVEKGAGEIVAKMVVEERVSVLLDLSHFRKSEVAVFMADFLETLYRLKAKESQRTPLMLIVDEADALFPQKPNPGEERMLGAGEDIVRRGGQRGIGCMMITQRTAVLNKNVLTQCEMLVAMRTISPQDLKAMQAWVDVHGTLEERDTLMASLPSLPQGDAWFWSPGWPTSDGIFKRVHVLPIETFDSGATPKSGERRTEPKTVADVDLGALQRQMASTIEKAKADDPKTLRAEIASLKKQIGAKVIGKVDHATMTSQVDAAVNAARAQWARDLKRIIAKDLVRLAGAIDAIRRPLADATARTEAAVTAFLALDGTLSPNGELTPQVAAQVRPTRAPRQSEHTAPSRPIAPRAAAGTAGDRTLGKGERTVLIAIAQYPDGAEREQLTVLTGYRRSSRDTYIQRLSASGYVEVTGGAVRATDAGIDALGSDYEPLPTGEALQEYWLNRLGGGERKILEVLLSANGEPVSRDQISEQTEYQRSSRDTYLQRLSSRRLVESVGRGEVRASATLFE